MRLDKYLAHAGYGTRSEVKKIIKKGTVMVDGALCIDPGIEIKAQEVNVDGQVVHYEEFYYLMMNKPAGVLSASKDARQPTVLDLIGDEIPVAVHVVGRLDKDSTGLLLLTNDGALAHQLLSPKKKQPKVYYVKLDSKLDDDQVKLLEQGIILDNKRTLPCQIRSISQLEYEITLFEGRYHQIKRMMRFVDRHVLFLHRVQIGKVKLDRQLKEGKYRRLYDEELTLLKVLR